MVYVIIILRIWNIVIFWIRYSDDGKWEFFIYYLCVCFVVIGFLLDILFLNDVIVCF